MRRLAAWAIGRSLIWDSVCGLATAILASSLTLSFVWNIDVPPGARPCIVLPTPDNAWQITAVLRRGGYPLPGGRDCFVASYGSIIASINEESHGYEEFKSPPTE